MSVGRVDITLIDGVSKEFSNGDIEDQLLSLFRGQNSRSEITKILEDGSVWHHIYHLSPQRGNIVSWYNFKPGSTVLEIGSGPGAATSALTAKDIIVTGIDIRERRSMINAGRHKDKNNLNLIVGNFDRYSVKEMFDYVVCVGALEYSGSFSEQN